MRQKSVPEKRNRRQKVVKKIRRATRRHFSAEDKIRIVLEGLRGEDSIAELCRREGIVQNLYYRWSKDFLEAGKKATGWRYGPGRDLGRGQGPASRGQRAEGGRGRADPRKSSAQKKSVTAGWGGSHMRYPASEKFEIIQLVEESALPVRRDAGKDRHSACHLLPLVRSVPGRRAGSPGRSDILSRIASGTAFPTMFAEAHHQVGAG